MRSDNMKTHVIPEKEKSVKTIGIVLDACLNKRVSYVDTNMHVFLSNIDLRQNEWRSRCRSRNDGNWGWVE